jgi:hypothetical protein
MTPLDFTNIDEPLIRPLPGAVALEPRTALVPLTSYDACRAALVACRSTDEVRTILDKSAMLRAYAKRAKDRSLEADAYEIRSRAERRLGEMLIEQKATVGFNTGAMGIGPIVVPPGNRNLAPTLAEAGIDKKLSMTAQRIAKLPPDEFDRVVAENRECIMAVGRERAPLDHLTGNIEWFTDPAWVNRVRDALGGIDLDPASCEFAQRTVQAMQFFTKEQDGLTQPWHNRVFLNPPFRRDLIAKFVAKLISERPNYEQAIALVNADTSTEWFQTLCGAANAIAFPKRRLVFYNEITQQQNPVFGSAFVYIGDRPGAFAEAFSGSCLILRPEAFAEARHA